MEGKVTAINPEVDPQTRNIRVQATLSNPQERLRPGMFVNVRLMLGEQNRAFLIPTDAVKRDTSGAFVQVVDPEGKVQQKRVTAETLYAGKWVVTEGLADGEQVIVTGSARLRPGMLAKAVPYEPPRRDGAGPQSMSAAPPRQN